MTFLGAEAWLLGPLSAPFFYPSGSSPLATKDRAGWDHGMHGRCVTQKCSVSQGDPAIKSSFRPLAGNQLLY